MLSNFGLSSKSQPKHYIELDPDDELIASASQRVGGGGNRDDDKRVVKSRSALSRYLDESRRNAAAAMDFDDIPSDQLQAELKTQQQL